MSTHTNPTLLEIIMEFIDGYTSGRNDDSYDYLHVERVVGLAYRIFKAEQIIHPELSFGPAIMALEALMPNVEDHQRQALEDEEEEEEEDDANRDDKGDDGDVYLEDEYEEDARAYNGGRTRTWTEN